MELIRNDLNIDYMRLRWISGGLSLLLAIYCGWVWIQKGEAKFGVDFSGGSEVWVRFEQPVETAEVRGALEKAGIDNAVVQKFESDTADFSIRAKTGHGADSAKAIIEALKPVNDGKFEIRKQDFVGPVIGEQIRRDGIKALIFSLLGILAYVSFQFEWRFAVASIIALFHDVWLTIGLYLVFGGEISSAVLAGILTTIGYSVNDTIVIFDRVRENLAEAYKQRGKKAKGQQKEQLTDLVSIFNASVNQTMSRTLLTGSTVLSISIVLWLFAGGDVSDLALILILGLFTGTYSTIFIASPLVVAMAPRDRNLSISRPSSEE